ncbi:unnamed protein product [Cylicocyclus nassatus]|uniref:Uncharacterized protein n=1 Tax=Cylicocyclus nassatus TaxID=53992 RepID=A0AA36MAF6_CYLNA|nr:unnamed protein product [Cylicocyclus nassatus]
MLQKDLKRLKKTIKNKVLRKPSSKRKEKVLASVVDRGSGSTQSFQEEEDPYKQKLRKYDDNVSHLVLHGSSLNSMSNHDFGAAKQEVNKTTSSSLDTVEHPESPRRIGTSRTT